MALDDKRPHRAWCFTYNNYKELPDEFCELLDDVGIVRYCVFQEEVSPSGTPHLQGYLELSTPRRRTYLSSRLPVQIHWEPRMGTRQQAIDYCKKHDETYIAGPYEYGTQDASGQGRRTDLAGAMELARETRSLKAIADTYPCTFVKFHRGIRAWLNIMQSNEWRPNLEVVIHYGSTGSGKSRRGFTDHPNLYRKPPEKTWFDGYDGHKVVLFDEFAGKKSKMSLVYFLQIIDIYPVQVETKGGFVPFAAELIIITTNIHPRDWYDFSTRPTQYRAIARRVNKVFLHEYINDKAYRRKEVSKQDFFDNPDNYLLL